MLVDRFLEDAIEVDVDAVRDAAGEILIGGIMEHVEEAGVHSGDSACALPPQSLGPDTLEALECTHAFAGAPLEVRGLINVQYAVKDGLVYVLEANPRASRTVPFVAKATGVPLAMVAARVMVGHTLALLRDDGLLPAGAIGQVPTLDHVSVKEAVLPFDRFPGVDTLLGPEMRSTGEVMGVDITFGLAFAKSQLAAGTRLPDSGTVFLSLADRDKRAGLEAARSFAAMGFSIAATLGTAGYFRSEGLTVDTLVAKVGEEGVASDAVELLAQGKVQLVVNTPRGLGPRADGQHIRMAAIRYHVPCLTTLAAARAAAGGMADRARAPVRGALAPGAPRHVGAALPMNPGADLATTVGSVHLPNPIMTASGTSGHGAELADYGDLSALGAVVVKSLCVQPWPGNPAPRVHEVGSGMLNSVGLQGPGLAAWLEQDLPALSASGARVVVSIWGRSVAEFGEAAALVARRRRGSRPSLRSRST